MTVTLVYQATTSTENVTLSVAGLVSATDPMPPTPAPGNVAGGFTVTSYGQDGTGQPYEQGFEHLVVTAPNGVSFDSATFSQIVWQLSDEVGIAWDSTNDSLAHNHIYATFRADTPTIVDLYFPPVRDESPPSGTDSATMLLSIALAGDSQVYATPFAGPAWDPTLLTSPPNSQTPPSPPTTEAQLRTDLMSESPEFDTIDLPADQTIVISQPLEITHSVHLVGNHATLLFQQGATAPWPASASGALYVNAPAYTNVQLELDDFTIAFDSSEPIQWSNPEGTQPAIWDPENDQGIAHAVIDTRDSNLNLNRVGHDDLRSYRIRWRGIF
jgi:hypothetical protein